MNILLTTIAIVAIILSGMTAIITPMLAVVRSPKEPYGWSDAIQNAIEFVMILLLALRVLEKI